MDTRSIKSRAHARGAIRPTMLAVIVIFVLLAVGAWILIIQPHQELVMQDSGGHPSTPVSSTRVAAVPTPANVEAMDLNQLLSEARKAINEGRLLAPAGNNAFEFYLKALEKQPGNAVATEALRETFPFAATNAEQVINDRNFNEAQRQIDLLAKADPANYTLTILRSKLDAQRKLLDREQQQALEDQRQQQLAAEKSAEKAAEKKAAEAKASQVAQQGDSPAASGTVGQTGDALAAKAAPVVPQSTPAILVSRVEPRYPVQAQRMRREGYVDVEYTVESDGSVGDTQIVDAQPRHLFDREAVAAIKRWQFKPATRNGQPVSTKLRQHFVFSLRGGNG